MAGPKESYIRRFHCTVYPCGSYTYTTSWANCSLQNVDTQTGPGKYYQLSEIISQGLPAGGLYEANGKKCIRMIVHIGQQRSLVDRANLLE